MIANNSRKKNEKIITYRILDFRRSSENDLNIRTANIAYSKKCRSLSALRIPNSGSCKPEIEDNIIIAVP
jgi:hypothetical protein